MRIQLHDDVTTFVPLARRFYEADPVRHTLALTSLEGVRTGTNPPALMVSLHRDGDVTGVALRVEGRSVVVSGLPVVCVTAVDAAAAAVDPAPSGVVGPVAQARAYAAAVAARTGAQAEVAMRHRLFQLVSLRCSAGVAGHARRAEHGDVELLARWETEFTGEALPPAPATDPRPGLRDAIARGAGIHLWEVDGVPVAYASARVPIAGMSRIGPVYTPKAQRGRGYGTAVTAAATAWALDAGARDVVLFTDLANPVSNAVYPRIGYRPVEDVVEMRFVRRSPA